MGLCVCSGAQMMCSFGTAPSVLMIPPGKVTATTPAATIMDYAPMANIMPFAMCVNPANPATTRPPPVVFSPSPCVPATTAPWAPGVPSVLIGGFPALDNQAKLMCMWGGVIQIINPGQTKCTVGK